MDIIVTLIIFIFIRFIWKELTNFFNVNEIAEFLKQEGILCDTTVPSEIDRKKEWCRKGGPWIDPQNPNAQTIFKPCKSRRKENASLDDTSTTIN